MMPREYKWSDDIGVYINTASINLICVVVINLIGEKVLNISLSPDPSKSVINFIKMTASISFSNLFLDYIDKKHII